MADKKHSLENAKVYSQSFPDVCIGKLVWNEKDQTYYTTDDRGHRVYEHKGG